MEYFVLPAISMFLSFLHGAKSKKVQAGHGKMGGRIFAFFLFPLFSSPFFLKSVQRRYEGSCYIDALMFLDHSYLLQIPSQDEDFCDTRRRVNAGITWTPFFLFLCLLFLFFFLALVAFVKHVSDSP